jgi:formate/nitrite transporter FocA (FNT family)
MSENPYESPVAHIAPDRTNRPIKLNSFDKFCATIGFAMGLVLLILGAVGLFMGCTAYFTLPPVFGVIPAFAGWGITRGIYVAWKMTNRSGANQHGAENLANCDLPPGPNAA